MPAPQARHQPLGSPASDVEPGGLPRRRFPGPCRAVCTLETAREANAYGTVKARGIPRLIESNAHWWEEVEVEPYIVTDFIEGPTLRQWREKRERVELDEAIAATRELLAILSKRHEAGLVHQDVKPDNIILADDDPGRPVLLDFGLSFRKGSDIDFETKHGQEVGNHFPRLAELSAGSLLKHDERSDLSFAVGIFFYLLTGEPPYILQDPNGRLPHQRDEALAMLQELKDARAPDGQDSTAAAYRYRRSSSCERICSHRSR